MSRSEELFEGTLDRLYRRTSRMFLWLLLGQWVFAIVLALVISPFTYSGTARSLHVHVKAAIGFGAVINALPIFLILKRPTWWGTRQTIAIVQMLWSALLIMITGGRIETHFHVFGSLAFLAFFRDWRVLPTATVVVALDHLARGLWWPDSVYGIANPEWWRFLEHAAWVAFEDVFLAWSCIRGTRELREAAEREASLEHMEGTDAMPYEYDIEAGGMTYIAPRIAAMLGCRADAWLACVAADERARVIAALCAFQGGRFSEPIDVQLESTSHRVVHVRMFFGHRRAARVRGLMFDITRQKQLEVDLRRAQHLESVGRLAAGVAHEINTPIQFVGDSLELATAGIADLVAVIEGKRSRDEDIEFLLGELPRAFERARDGTERVAKIVRSMKVFARPPQPTMEHIDLNSAIQSTLVVARNEYRYVADVETDFGELPPVACHLGEINQVVLNLVINAAHAIGDAAAGRGTIAVTTRRDEHYAVISIRDNGCGIPEHARDKIFEPFFTTKPVGKGTGQGLAIAHSVVVERHGGKLTFQSAVGKGTIFHVHLPLDTQQLGAAA